MKTAGITRPAYFLYQLFWSGVDWLFPPVCGGCGRAGIRWCEDCQRSITRISGPVCPRCGDPMPVNELCRDCANHPPEFDFLRSYGMFEGTLRAAPVEV
jgi:predicted amidophosphoribosyltransferase